MIRPEYVLVTIGLLMVDFVIYENGSIIIHVRRVVVDLLVLAGVA